MDRIAKFVAQLTDEELEMLNEYLKQMPSERSGKCARVEIPYKFPSLNEYVAACRGNMYNGAKFKKSVQRDIGWSILELPEFNRPVFIEFTWVEGNRKRDWDNVTYAKKFILDALVRNGKISDDSRKYVKGFKDNLVYSKGEWKVILEIREDREQAAEGKGGSNV